MSKFISKLNFNIFCCFHFNVTTHQTIVCKHIDDMKEILSIKWYETLKSIIANAIKRKWIPDIARPRSLSRFFNCVAAQMTQNLQDIAVRSLLKFTEFIRDVRNNWLFAFFARRII